MATHRVHLENTLNPSICEDGWDAAPGDSVAWTGAPSGGTSIGQAGNNTFPFNVTAPFTYPYPSTVYIKSNLAPGTYYYTVNCCPPQEATKTVNVT
jgi:hypothetical protein